MIGYIYKITAPDGKYYIGQTRNFERRMEAYKSLKCSSQPLIYGSLKKYGWNRHTVSILCTPDVEHLEEVEVGLIKSHKSCYRDNPMGLNVLKESYQEYCRMRHSLPKYKKTRRTRRVTQYTQWGDIIRTWGSSLDISKITGMSHKGLIKALRSKTGYYGQYQWRYEKTTRDSKH